MILSSIMDTMKLMKILQKFHQNFNQVKHYQMFKK